MSEPSSDLHELPDLAGDVRERVVIPPYSEVSRRVRARRLRVATGTLASAVLLVGGVAVWQGVATTAGPSAPQPAGSTQGPIPPTDESQWRAVVDGTDSHPFEVEGTDDGSVAVVWRALEPGAPTYALVIREADGSVHGMRLDEPVSLTPVPGGWVGMDGSRGHLIGSDGTWSDLVETAPRQPEAGDVVVTGQYSTWLYSPVDQGLSGMQELEGGSADGYVTPAGELVTCRQDGQGEISVSPTGKMISGLPGQSCLVAGRGADAAVVALGVAPDGGIPMTGLMTMTGLTPGHSPTWNRLEVRDLLNGVTSVVVTPAGSTVVTDAGEGRWLVVRPDGDVVEPARKVGEAFVAGDRLYVSTYGLMNGPLYVSDDDGRTWQETTMPGNESKQG
jgi:hypothetical protein